MDAPWLLTVIASGAIFMSLTSIFAAVEANPLPELPQLNHTGRGEDLKIRVDVYYESLCPDAREFFLRELQPTWADVRDIMDVRLVPFGKARSVLDEHGDVTFHCQHGPIECTANLVHACAIQHVADKDRLLKLIFCMIKDNYDPLKAGKTCSRLHDVPWLDLLTCISSRAGLELMNRHENATRKLVPKLSTVPTVLIGGKRRIRSEGSLKTEICRVYQGVRPTNCIEIL